MILEAALLDVKPGQESQFEVAFCEAQKIILNMEGYISHQLQKCLEKPNRYALLVNRENIEDHINGFRGSPEYRKWRKLLHHFYQPFPEVKHYSLVFENTL